MIVIRYSAIRVPQVDTEYGGMLCAGCPGRHVLRRWGALWVLGQHDACLHGARYSLSRAHTSLLLFRPSSFLHLLIPYLR